MLDRKNNGVKWTMDEFIDQLVSPVLQRCFDDYLEEKLTPFLRRCNQGDPLQTYTTCEVAKLLKVSESTIRRLERTRKLPAIRVSEGKRSALRFRSSEIEAYQINQTK